jgi:hypothetical protein
MMGQVPTIATLGSTGMTSSTIWLKLDKRHRRYRIMRRSRRCMNFKNAHSSLRLLLRMTTPLKTGKCGRDYMQNMLRPKKRKSGRKERSNSKK